MRAPLPRASWRAGRRGQGMNAPARRTPPAQLPPEATCCELDVGLSCSCMRCSPESWPPAKTSAQPLSSGRRWPNASSIREKQSDVNHRSGRVGPRFRIGSVPEKILKEVTLDPKGETVLSAPYDLETHLPRVVLRVSIPKHVRRQVEIKEELIGKPGNCLQTFRVKNGSAWPAFLTLVELS